jgi:hypothetical protein
MRATRARLGWRSRCWTDADIEAAFAATMERRTETLEPGRAARSAPGSASKIVTLTTSPMLSVIHGGGRENTFEALVLHGVLGSACAVAWYLAPQSFGCAAAAGARKRIARPP